MTLGAELVQIDKCLCGGAMIDCPSELLCLSLNSFHFSTSDSGVECKDECITCNDPNICILCYPNIIISNGVCECPKNYIFNLSTKVCEINCKYFNCYPKCLNCDGCNSLSCTTCLPSYYLLFDSCSICPSGFEIINEVCTFMYSLIISIRFDKLPVGDDQFSSLSFPKLHHLRGGYFDGVTIVNTTKYTISADFGIKIWFFSRSPQGCLLSRQNKDNFISIISFCISDNMLRAYFTLSNSIQEIDDIQIINPDQWNLLTFWVKYESTENFYFQFILNSIKISYFSVDFIYDDNLSSESFIGAKLASQMFYDEYYIGFIYQVLIFNKPGLSILESKCSGNCEICMEGGNCFSLCAENTSLKNGICGECNEGNKDS